MYETTLNPVALATVKAYFKVEGMKALPKEEITPADVLYNLDIDSSNQQANDVQAELRTRIINLTATETIDPSSVSDEQFNQLLQAIVNDPANGLSTQEAEEAQPETETESTEETNHAVKIN